MKTIRLLLALLLAAGLSSSRAQNTWTKKADFGGMARGGAVGFSIGGKGYIGTGYHNGAIYKDFWEFDFSTNAWTQKADYAGSTTYRGAGFAIGNKGYVGTGSKGGTDFSKDFWEYDPAANTWTQKADFGGSGRYAVVSFSIGNKGYVGTGFNWGANGGTATNLKDFWEYDPTTDKWTKKADYAGGICNWASGFSIGTKGYIGTGITGNPFGGILTKQFWEYDPVSDTWTQKANFGGTARNAAVGFAIGDKGYIGTGTDGSLTKDFWEYDPVSDVWTQKANFGGTARNVAVGFAIGNKGYIGTGNDGSDRKDFWEYNPSCNGMTMYADADGDSYGDASNSSFVVDCIAPTGYVYDSTDCNDGNATIHPGACDASNGNGIDENCDGFIDNGFGATTYYADVDGDGYGAGSGTSLCSNPGTGYSVNSTDCDDNNVVINPNAYEIIGDGIDNNCNGLVDEDINNAVNFDGVNDYVQLPSVLNQATKFTIEYWIKTTENGTNATPWYRNTMVGNESAGSSSGDFGITSNNGFIGMWSGLSSTGDQSMLSAKSINDDEWHHIAAVNNGNTITLYVDGVLLPGSIPSGLSLKTTSLPLRIGMSNPEGFGGGNHRGTYDEVRFWNVARTQTEIQSDMNLSICSNTSGLAAYYPLNQGIAGGNNTGIIIANDVTLNNNEGTLYNFALTGPGSNWVAGTPNVISVINIAYYQDADGDGFGNPFVTQLAGCAAPSGYVIDNTDCNDANAAIHPGATEVCNSIDDNCNGVIDDACGDGCTVPANPVSGNITGSKAKLSWDYVTTALSYKIHYKMAGASAWSTPVYTAATSKYISGLTPNTLYYWEVKSVCSKDNRENSEWSAQQSFTTAAFRMGDVQTSTLQLYPNPVTESFTLDLQLNATTPSAASIYLLNSIGQIVFSSNEVTGNGTLSKEISMPSTAASGWYIVRVVMSDQVIERKLIFQK